MEDDRVARDQTDPRERTGGDAQAINRSQFLRNSARLSLLASSGSLLAAASSQAKQPKAQPKRSRARATSGGISHRGVNYDVGTNYDPSGPLSRELWSNGLMHGEIDMIRDDLNCNAVNVYGSDIGRIVATATYALQQGLKVWIQPRLIESTKAQMLSHLSDLADEAETLRGTYGSSKVFLDVGCELSIFMAGIIPGATFYDRIDTLINNLDQLPTYNRRLNRHLRHCRQTARAQFDGQITYGSGIWEDVHWTHFDLVGLNYYRDSTNEATYEDDLGAFFALGKPVVITEFGCCTFVGADDLGADGDGIADFSVNPPVITGSYTRSEKTQADYLGELLDIYESLGAYGTFAFEFIEPPYPHSTNPTYDLDMASFGIVKVIRDDFEDTASTYTALPKRGFRRLARRYGLYL